MNLKAISLLIHFSSFPLLPSKVTEIQIEDVLLVKLHAKAHNHLQVVVVLDVDNLHSITCVDVDKI